MGEADRSTMPHRTIEESARRCTAPERSPLGIQSGYGSPYPCVVYASSGWPEIGTRCPEQVTLAAIVIGLCTAIKVYPALLIVGLIIRGRRTMAIVALASGALAVGVSEAVLGLGVTRSWLGFVPLNTLHYVDEIGNNSLVRLVRSVIPGASPALAKRIPIENLIYTGVTNPSTLRVLAISQAVTSFVLAGLAILMIVVIIRDP